MKQTLQNKRGRLGSCVPTSNGHYYRSKYVTAWDPIGWSVLPLRAAAPPVSHHLNQRLPVSLFSHSHVASNKYSIA